MTIDAKTVKQLRDRTGAGMMDCKNALKSNNGDMDKAVEYLRKSGIAKADRKSSRKTDQGIIFSYIHPGNRIGVIVEVNCETDFVAKNDRFTSFVKDIAMQIAATNPITIKREDVEETIVEREKHIYKEQAKLLGKPEKVIDRIVGGRLEKYYQENCLLEQPFIKDTEKSVQELLTETIATLGENVHISRFARFEVGEGIPSDSGS